MELFTIGYEGLDIDEFTSFLKKKRIQLIADVRKNPVSRKKGFSKHKMAAALKEKGIDYVHLPGLGTPSAWRKQADKGLLTREKMFENFAEEIIPTHPDEMDQLRQLMREKRMALLCYEADATDCHRKCLADEIVKLEKGKVEVVDLKLTVSKVKPLREANL